MALEFSPASITLTESNPASVSAFRVRAKQVGSGNVLQDQTFPASGASVTVIDLSVGFFDVADNGASVFFTVQEQGPGGWGPEQTKMLPDGSAAEVYQVVAAAPNGAEDIQVTV